MNREPKEWHGAVFALAFLLVVGGLMYYLNPNIEDSQKDLVNNPNTPQYFRTVFGAFQSTAAKAISAAVWLLFVIWYIRIGRKRLDSNTRVWYVAAMVAGLASLVLMIGLRLWPR